jgi:hypothetical protein
MAGRPRGSAPRDTEIKIRVTKDGKEAAVRAAAPLSVSDWVRKLMADDIAKRGLQ